MLGNAALALAPPLTAEPGRLTTLSTTHPSTSSQTQTQPRSDWINGSDIDTSMNTSQPASTPVRACDSCRMRRKKCDITISDNTDGFEACNRCTRLGLRCTFNCPPKARGRKKKKQTLGSPRGNTPDVSQIPNPIVQAQNHNHHLSSSNHDATPAHTTSLDPYFDGTHSHLASIAKQQQGATLPQDSYAQNILPPFTLDPGLEYPTDDLCSRQLLTVILEDYLHFVYPLVPVVHIPSLIADLREGRDIKDKDFHSLLCCLCGMVVSILPRQFKVYKCHQSGLKFERRLDMLNHCHKTIMTNRGPTYFDQVNHCKWAIAYAMCIAFYHIGEHNRSRMMDVESMQIARMLYFHISSEYNGLNYIETQLRKKAFWLVFYSYIHNELQILRRERMSYLDHDTLELIRLQDMLPLEVDDEFIFEDRVIPQPSSKPSVMTGFIAHSRVFWAALKSTRTTATNSGEETCHCYRAKHPELELAHLKSRLRELKYLLDDTTPRLRQWAPTKSGITEPPNPSQRPIVESQFAIMRANLHSTHIWLQSILLDQLETLLENNKELMIQLQTPSVHDHIIIWTEREELARQLLHVLHSIPQQYLEPSGLHLTEKVRDVAVSILSSPYAAEDERTKRAAGYIRDFAEIMARFGLDPIHTSNTQSWIDSDRFTSSHRLADIPSSVKNSWNP